MAKGSKVLFVQVKNGEFASISEPEKQIASREFRRQYGDFLSFGEIFLNVMTYDKFYSWQSDDGTSFLIYKDPVINHHPCA